MKGMLKLYWTILLFSVVPYVDAQICDGESWAPDRRYTINEDVVLDNKTGLVWKRCAEGMRWNGYACRGFYETLS